MSHNVVLGDGVSIPLFPSTIHTIVDHLSDHATEYPEFNEVVKDRELYDGIGDWYFEGFSPEAFKKLNYIINEMSNNLQLITDKNNWPVDQKYFFYIDFNNFKSCINRFVERFG